jgi:hypothetical protein
MKLIKGRNRWVLANTIVQQVSRRWPNWETRACASVSEANAPQARKYAVEGVIPGLIIPIKLMKSRI